VSSSFGFHFQWFSGCGFPHPNAIAFYSLTTGPIFGDHLSALIEQWLKNKDTVLFLAAWERINNLGFNSLEFEGIKT
jgi:hypothetical protein